MASGIYNRLKANMLNKLVDLGSGGDTLKIALFNNSHAFNADHNTLSDVTANQITGTGYTAGGATLTSQTVTQDDTNDRGVFDAADASWSSASFTAYHAVIYDDTLAGDDLICSIDFGGAQTVTSATFTLQFSTDGILYFS